MVEEAKKKGTYVGTLIGAVVVSLLSSGVLSGAVNWGTAEKAEEGAREAVAKDAKAEAATAEKAIANYIEKEVEPKVTEAFEAVADDIDVLNDRVMKCETDLREATIIADTALRLVERSFGRRAVARELDRVERDEPKPPPEPKAKAKKKLDFKDYEQKIVVPKMGE
jgi:hypothetical protein